MSENCSTRAKVVPVKCQALNHVLALSVLLASALTLNPLWHLGPFQYPPQTIQGYPFQCPTLGCLFSTPPLEHQFATPPAVSVPALGHFWQLGASFSPTPTPSSSGGSPFVRHDPREMSLGSRSFGFSGFPERNNRRISEKEGSLRRTFPRGLWRSRTTIFTIIQQFNASFIPSKLKLRKRRQKRARRER